MRARVIERQLAPPSWLMPACYAPRSSRTAATGVSSWSTSPISGGGRSKSSIFRGNGAPDTIRTCDLCLRRQRSIQLSYGCCSSRLSAFAEPRNGVVRKPREGLGHAFEPCRVRRGCAGRALRNHRGHGQLPYRRSSRSTTCPRSAFLAISLRDFIGGLIFLPRNHSTTSSACARRSGGTSMPSARAVLRLRTSW